MPAFRVSAFAFSLLMAILVSGGIASAQQKATAGNQKDKKGTPAPAAQKGTPAKGEPVDMIRTAADGWPIHMTYFESSAGKESPVVILLTGTEGPDKKDARNRRIWQPTAIGLQKAGFAVMTVDLRKHGDSIPAAAGAEPPVLKIGVADYPLMAAADLEAVKAFLLEEHRAQKLNIRKLGIVAMGSSSMVAATFAVEDWAKKPYPDGPTLELSTPRGQDVRALFMYSPSTNVKGINSTTAMKVIKGLQIAVHVVASKDNKEDAKNAEKIFRAVDLKDEALKEFRKITFVPGEVRSEGFLEGRFAEATNKDIADFLTKNLKELEAPWAPRVDRRQE